MLTYADLCREAVKSLKKVLDMFVGSECVAPWEPSDMPAEPPERGPQIWSPEVLHAQESSDQQVANSVRLLLCVCVRACVRVRVRVCMRSLRETHTYVYVYIQQMANWSRVAQPRGMRVWGGRGHAPGGHTNWVHTAPVRADPTHVTCIQLSPRSGFTNRSVSFSIGRRMLTYADAC